LRHETLPVATFNELKPALALREQFAHAGIPALIHDESKLERFWFMTEPLAAIHVEVSQPDFLKARRLMQEWEPGSDVLKATVRCPECGSSRVEFPQITRKFLMPVVETLFMAVHLIPREYYCEDCHYTWPKEKPVEPERDLLGFPLDSAIGIPSHRAPKQH
jgi:ribosomal protein S27AE